MSDNKWLFNPGESVFEAHSPGESHQAPALESRARVAAATPAITLDRLVADIEPDSEASVASSRPAVDRRKRKRAHVKMSAVVRSSQSIQDSFREIVTTENASRDGLCFRTKSSRYQAGMKLRVTFPYSSHSDADPSSENPAEIVRLETFPDGSFRVAVTLNPPSYSAASNHSANYSGKSAAARPAKERRQHKRSELSAVSVLREEQSEIVMHARCSELSVGGCYIDTLNPFTIGTSVLVEIQKGEHIFTTYATVCSSHRGSGMGLSFHALPPEKISFLSNWLS